MTEYAEYDLHHWEDDEFDNRLRIWTSQDGTFHVTAEALAGMVKRYSPVGYKEGEIGIDIPVESFLAFWKELGGDYAKR